MNGEVPPGVKVTVRIRRQEDPRSPSRFEEFAVPYRRNMNVTSCLQYIAANPVTTDGRQTSPPVWEAGCLEEVCGACTMVINGRVRQACSALVEKLGAPAKPIVLEPLAKFPLVRDLMVDRQRLFEDLKRTKCWMPLDGTYDLGPGPVMTDLKQMELYPLTRCISCGCCLEACPQYTAGNRYVGAAIISQVRFFNNHPTAVSHKEERLDILMQEGGVSDCAKAGNCVKVCPKKIPLLESIASVQREATIHALKRLFGR